MQPVSFLIPLHRTAAVSIIIKKAPFRMAKCTDPRLTDKEKSVQSQNSGELHGLAPDFKRSEAVFQVDPLIVVESHILRHRLFD